MGVYQTPDWRVSPLYCIIKYKYSYPCTRSFLSLLLYITSGRQMKMMMHQLEHKKSTNGGGQFLFLYTFLTIIQVLTLPCA